MPKMRQWKGLTIKVKPPERNAAQVFKEDRSRNAMIKRYRDMAVVNQGYECHYCFDAITHETATADHRVALANGGKHREIVAACFPCNQAKEDLEYGEFVSMISSDRVPTKINIGLVWVRRRLNERLKTAKLRIRFAVYGLKSVLAGAAN